LEERSIEAFWHNFDKYAEESRDEFNKYFPDFKRVNMFVAIDNVSFKLGNWPECDFNHVVINIPMYYKDKYIGYYNIYFDLNGKADDDCFVIV
jgi:hypothetical protein